MSDLEQLETELRRIVDRLSSMPLARAERCSEDCHALAGLIVEHTRALDAGVPPDAALPRLAPQGLAALLAVVGGDYLDAAKAAPDADVRPVLDRVVDLRRGLP